MDDLSDRIYTMETEKYDDGHWALVVRFDGFVTEAETTAYSDELVKRSIFSGKNTKH